MIIQHGALKHKIIYYFKLSSKRHFSMPTSCLSRNKDGSKTYRRLETLLINPARAFQLVNSEERKKQSLNHWFVSHPRIHFDEVRDSAFCHSCNRSASPTTTSSRNGFLGMDTPTGRTLVGREEVSKVTNNQHVMKKQSNAQWF